MYWRIVGMTASNCWIIFTNMVENQRFHPEKEPNLNVIVIGGSIKKDTWSKNIFLNLRGFVE